ncbi:GtrA family protein [Fontisphaera persica]|uniref:GtrA family protein n=1 Tax=Fontisphaera persica TaxID=2974023 RepID=UPI0024C05DC0|nr:GtrA family protein [Fontisphaera persica]WCJ61123.1 GtrA family protein [Fontisphaera persica]
MSAAKMSRQEVFSQGFRPGTKLEVCRFAKFCVVGGSGVVVDMGMLFLLADPRCLGLNLSLSKILAAETALANNFLWNELWTFRPAEGSPPGHRGWPRRFLLFNLICGAGIGLAVLLLQLFHNFFGLNLYLANFIVIGLITGWNYGLCTLVAWNHKVICRCRFWLDKKIYFFTFTGLVCAFVDAPAAENKSFSASGIMTFHNTISTNNMSKTPFNIKTDGSSWSFVYLSRGILVTNTYIKGENTVYLYTTTLNAQQPVGTLTKRFDPTGNATAAHLLWFVYISSFDASVGTNHIMSAPFMLYLEEAHIYDITIKRHELWPYAPVQASFEVNIGAYKKVLADLDKKIRNAITDEELKQYNHTTQYMHSICTTIPAEYIAKHIATSNDVAIPTEWELCCTKYERNTLRRHYYHGLVTNVTIGEPVEIAIPTPLPGTHVTDVRSGNQYNYRSSSNWLAITDLPSKAKLVPNQPEMAQPRKWYETRLAYKITKLIPSGIVALAFIIPLIFLAKSTKHKHKTKKAETK